MGLSRGCAVQIVSCSPDDGAQYRAMMNATFAAQRLTAPIDACCLGATDSAFLQQAAHITGGTYTFPLGGGSAAARGGVAATPAASGGQRRQLYQHLLSTFLADSDTRKQLVQQKPPSLDLRPACFKTKRIVDVGCAPHPAVTQPLPRRCRSLPLARSGRGSIDRSTDHPAGWSAGTCVRCASRSSRSKRWARRSSGCGSAKPAARGSSHPTPRPADPLGSGVSAVGVC